MYEHDGGDPTSRLMDAFYIPYVAGVCHEGMSLYVLYEVDLVEGSGL